MTPISTPNRLTLAFMQWGWLTPAFLPLAQVLGRGMFNTLSALYFLWALAALPALRAPLGRAVREPFFLIYALMLVIWALSLTMAIDPTKGLETLARYIQFSLTGLFTLLVLRSGPERPAQLVHALALGAVFTLAVLYVQLPYYVWGTSFNPTLQLREDNLPWLLPLLLAGLVASPRARWLAAGLALAVGFYIVLSQGRAALAAFVVALAAFAALGLGLRKRTLAVTIILVLAVGIFASDRFFRDIEHLSLDFATLDIFTSGRATIWYQAWHMPPENPWLGVGIGNVSLYHAVLQINDLTVKHLHNFLFDAWFETGWLGLTALIGLIGIVYVHLARNWHHLDAPTRRIAAAAIAASLAILVAGLFSFSYTSRQFALYLYLLFALMLSLPGQPRPS